MNETKTETLTGQMKEPLLIKVGREYYVQSANNEVLIAEVLAVTDSGIIVECGGMMQRLPLKIFIAEVQNDARTFWQRVFGGAK